VIKIINNFFSILSNSQKFFFYKLQILIVISSLLEILSIAGLAVYFSMILEINDFILHIKSIEIISNFSDKKIIVFSGLLLIFVFFVSSILNITAIKFQNSFMENTGSDFAQRLYNYYLSQDYLYFINNDTNIILKKITADTTRFTDQFLRGLISLLSKVIICLLIFVILLIYNAKITLAVFFIILSFYIMTRKIFKKKVDTAGKDITIKLGLVYDYIASSLSGIREVIFYDRKKFLKTILSKNLNEIARSKSFLKTIGSIPKFFIELITFSILILLIIFFSIVNTPTDDIIFNLAIFGSAGYKLLPAMQTIYYAAIDLYGHRDSFESIYPELLSEKNLFINKKKNKISKEEISEVSSIKLKGVSFGYNENINLENISIVFEKKQKIGIVGKSGSGKSTLIDLILGFIRPDFGKIIVNDIEIDDLTINSYRNSVGFVPQNIFLFNDTISKNIILDKDFDKINIAHLSKICLLDEFIEENKINILTDKIGNSGKMLSGGQKQRIGIARALYSNPKVLILDEATNALDSLSQNKIISNIYKYTDVNIVILVTHNTNLLKGFDKIIVLDDGKKISEGSYDELLNENILFKQFKKNNDND
jgi:ATP-binding cassette, subfamily B, bacterial PglK|tara:strand:+ start:2601 stop:4388 length:1788 start_codon:yes stop_codon:yes gene_type:complete